MNLRPATTALALVAMLTIAVTAAACGSGDDHTGAPTTTPPASSPTSPATSGATPTPPVASTTPASTTSPDTPVNSSDTPAAPTPTIAVPADRERVLAPIDGAEIIVRESFPPQYAVHVTSGLPSGCALFAGITTTRAESEITITVENSVPRDKTIACTQIYGMHEETVELGSDFTPGATYTVKVNDRALTLAAQ